MSNGEANATTKTSWEGLQGFNFYNKYSESVAGAGATNTIYFPNSGQTLMNVLLIKNENIGGTYWTATPSSKMSNGLRTVPYLNFGMFNSTTSFLGIENNYYHYPFTVRCTREE